jgi:hypothetical protein
MKPGEVAELVDRGIELRERIAKDTAELKKIEAKLHDAGLEAGREGEHEELKDTDREGRRWMARGSQKVLPVIFTADLIISTFTRGTDVHRKIDAIAGTRLNDFYKPEFKFANRFDNGKKFRSKAEEVFGPNAPAFITACISRDKHGIAKSAIKIAWDDVEPATPGK